MASSDQRFAHPSSPSHYASPPHVVAAFYPHMAPSPPSHPTAPYSRSTPSLLPHPAAFTAAHPGPSVAYVPGSFVAGVPFDGLPLHHQNFILKAATHCWKDQYADLQQDNERLRASLSSDREQRESMEDRVHVLEQRLSMQGGNNGAFTARRRQWLDLK